jgi:hypothetical protein
MMPMVFLEGGLENFIETAAFLAGSWDLCDSTVFQEHCKTAFDNRENPEQAATSWRRKR